MFGDPPPFRRTTSDLQVLAKPALRRIDGTWWVYVASTIAFNSISWEDACRTAKAWAPEPW